MHPQVCPEANLMEIVWEVRVSLPQGVKLTRKVKKKIMSSEKMGKNIERFA